MSYAFYFVVDEKYVTVAAVTGLHLAKQGSDVHIFVESSIEINVERFRNTRLFFHFNKLSKELPSDLPFDDKWPRIVYLRVFAPHILSNYEKLIYLDSDVAVLGSIEHLLMLEMGANCLAAVHDTGIIGPIAPLSNFPKRQWLANIGVRSGRYFNSGVLCINVSEWLKIDFKEELRNYFRRYGRYVRMWDQDFLNWLMQDRWVEISPRFNFQITLFNYGLEKHIKPILVHFTDGRKPWHWTAFDWNVGFVDYYSALAIAAGVDTEEFPLPHYASKRPRLRPLKTKLRLALHNAGFHVPKYSSAKKYWDEIKAYNYDFLRESIKSERFADIPPSTDFPDEEIDLVFNGRMLIDTASIEYVRSFITPI